MRRTLATLIVAAAAAAFVPVAPANAVCGGGAPGEACYCPDSITVGDVQIRTGINCMS